MWMLPSRSTPQFKTGWARRWPPFESAKIWINIDHHVSNPGYGDLVIIDPSAPATGEIIFRLIKSQGLPFDQRYCGKSFRCDLNRYRLVSISKNQRAHV